MAGEPRRGWSTARVARTGVLLLIFAIVGAWGISKHRRASLRREWNRPLNVAVVLLHQGAAPVSDLSLFGRHLDRLQQMLEGEFRRYRTDRDFSPFVFSAHGPVRIEREPPLPTDQDFVARAKSAWAHRRYFAEVLGKLPEPIEGFDVIMYVIAEPRGVGGRGIVEGVAPLDGDYAIVRATLDDTMVDPALVAIGHELLHTVGASDKYDGEGHAVAPGGLVEPALGYPQRFAEIMVGEVAIAPRRGELATRIEQVRVGDATAFEVGWQR